MQRWSRAAPPVSFGAARSRQNNCSRLTLMDVTSCAFPLHSFPHFYLLSFSLCCLFLFDLRSYLRLDWAHPQKLSWLIDFRRLLHQIISFGRRHIRWFTDWQTSQAFDWLPAAVRRPRHVTGPVFHILCPRTALANLFFNGPVDDAASDCRYSFWPGLTEQPRTRLDLSTVINQPVKSQTKESFVLSFVLTGRVMIAVCAEITRLFSFRFYLYFIPFDSPEIALSKVFWVQVYQSECSLVNK